MRMRDNLSIQKCSIDKLHCVCYTSASMWLAYHITKKIKQNKFSLMWLNRDLRQWYIMHQQYWFHLLAMQFYTRGHDYRPILKTACQLSGCQQTFRLFFPSDDHSRGNFWISNIIWKTIRKVRQWMKINTQIFILLILTIIVSIDLLSLRKWYTANFANKLFLILPLNAYQVIKITSPAFQLNIFYKPFYFLSLIFFSPCLFLSQTY